MIVQFQFLGMTFEADGALDPGDRGGWHEPPTDPYFEVESLKVEHGGKWINADWLFESGLADKVLIAATEAAQYE